MATRPTNVRNTIRTIDLFSGQNTHTGSADSRVVVFEDSDVILPCSLSTKEDIRSKMFVWKKDDQKYVFFSNAGSTAPDKQFEGRVFHFPDELQHGNASIIIRKTKVADSGKYTCIFPNLQPEQPSHIELVVGASPEPYVTIFKRENGVLLQCKVKGASPKPEVEWRDSSGNILHAEEPLVSETGGSFNITINITVTKTDTYHCVSTQKEIYHKIEAEIYVPLNEPNSGAKPGSGSTGFIVAVLLGILLVVAVVCLAVLYRKGCITLNFNRGSTSTSQQPPDGDEVQEKLSGPHLFQAV